VSGAIAFAMEKLGLTPEEAKSRFWICDEFGLLGKDRKISNPVQAPWIRKDSKDKMPLLEVIKQVKPTIFFGLTGVGGLWTEDIIREMAKHVKRPILFPLSNPTSKTECQAKDAFIWTEGRCIYGSGSPFDPVDYNGKKYYPSQANNMYSFPGLGLGALVSKATVVTDGMLYAAANALSNTVKLADLKDGKLFPRLREIRDVTKQIAFSIAKQAIAEGVSKLPPVTDLQLQQLIEQRFWTPVYGSVVYVNEIAQYQR